MGRGMGVNEKVFWLHMKRSERLIPLMFLLVRDLMRSKFA